MLVHRGDPRNLGDSIRKFIEWRRENGLHPRHSATFNILYDDPAETPPEQFRFGLCAATDRPIAPNEAGVISETIPGGRCAVLRHIGTDDTLADTFACLYREWLPGSGEELRDYPLFLQRLSVFPDVPDHEAGLDMYLPLK